MNTLMTDQRPMLLATLKGAPLSVVVCFLLYPDRSLGAAVLSRLTRWNRHAVADALRLLAEVGWAQQHGRYNAWMLTIQARQLLLGEGLFLTLDGLKTALPPPVVSSSLTQDPISDEKLLTNQLPSPAEGRKTALPPASAQPLGTAWQDLAAYLVDSCGTTASRARGACIDAAGAGADPAELLHHARCWLDYCRSDYGRGINNPGAFVASKVAAGAPTPEWYEPASADLQRPGYERFLTGPYADYFEH